MTERTNVASRLAAAFAAGALALSLASSGIAAQPSPAHADPGNPDIARMSLPSKVPFALKADGTVVGPSSIAVASTDANSIVTIEGMSTQPDLPAYLELEGDIARFSLDGNEVFFGCDAKAVAFTEGVKLEGLSAKNIAIDTKDASGAPYSKVSRFAASLVSAASIGHLDVRATAQPREVVVTLDPVGGTVAPAALNVTPGGQWPALPVPTKTGHIFEGWYTSAEGGEMVAQGNPVAISTETTLYARYSIMAYDVTFDDGIGGSTTVRVNHGAPLGDMLPLPPTQDGYEFDKWIAENGAEVTASTVVTAPMKATAQWRKAEGGIRAFAVYSADDNSLNFFKRADVPSPGDTIEGKTATEIYTGIEATLPSAQPWSQRASEISCVATYEEIAPSSLDSWFEGCTALASLDLTLVNTSQTQSTEDMLSGANLTQISIGAQWDKNLGEAGLRDSVNGSWVDLSSEKKYSPTTLPTAVAATYVDRGDLDAFAVYSADDNSLNFFKRADVPSPGDTIEGKTATAVYTGLEYSDYYHNDNSSLNTPWAPYRTSITSLNTYDPIAPRTMATWFFGFSRLVEINGLERWDVSNVSSFFYAFDGCRALADLSPLASWDVGSSVNFVRMFGYLPIADLAPLASWDVSSATTLASMFLGCTSLTDISSVANWNTSNVKTLYAVFSGCSKLSSAAPLASWNVSSATSFPLALSGTAIADLAPLASWDVSNGTDFHSMFSGCSKLSSAAPLSRWDVSNGTNFSSMFRDCGIRSLSGFERWDVSNGTNFSSMFEDAGPSYITNLSPLASWDVSNGTDFSNMFQECYVRSIVGLERWDVSNGTDFSYMFYGSSILNQDPTPLSQWNVSSGKDFTSMFNGAGVDNLTPLASWDVSSATSLASMFRTNNFTDLSPLATWDVSSVTDMSYMFASCSKLSSAAPLSRWDVSNVTNMYSIFSWCSALTSLDFSAWNTSSIATSFSMFSGCNKLQEIVLGPGWTLDLSRCALPSPSPTYIPEADGNWYDQATGEAFTPSTIPTGKAATYVAVKP